MDFGLFVIAFEHCTLPNGQVEYCIEADSGRKGSPDQKTTLGEIERKISSWYP
jgi:hypothetical protein